MENDFGKDHVPAQYTGTEMNAVEKIELGSEEEAIHFFKVVKERLLDVNRWAEIADVPMPLFSLTDAQGNEVQRKATDGDHKDRHPRAGYKSWGGVRLGSH